MSVLNGPALKRYVAGFLFDQDASCVALVRKNRPTWQAGFWNGIGGSIELFETPEDAMRREFREETGVDEDSWRHFATLSGPQRFSSVFSGAPAWPQPLREWEVHFFSAQGNPYDVATMTDEEIRVFQLDDLPRDDMLLNLNWLIPMALYEVPGRGMPFFIQEYGKN